MVGESASLTIAWPAPLGYEPYDARLCRLGRSPVAALASADSRRGVVSGLRRLPHPTLSRRVRFTDSFTKPVLDLGVPGLPTCATAHSPPCHTKNLSTCPPPSWSPRSPLEASWSPRGHHCAQAIGLRERHPVRGGTGRDAIQPARPAELETTQSLRSGRPARRGQSAPGPRTTDRRHLRRPATARALRPRPAAHGALRLHVFRRAPARRGGGPAAARLSAARDQMGPPHPGEVPPRGQPALDRHRRGPR
jgi:hypothetical protein